MPEEFDYQRYLASREWAVLRERVRERSRNTCERCRVLSQVAVHHLTYERVGHEDLTDLQAVCRLCHAFLSGKSDFDPVAFVRELTQPQPLPDSLELLADAITSTAGDVESLLFLTLSALAQVHKKAGDL